MWSIERLALITLYSRDHLDQVLATFGLILFFNELVRIIWGPSAVYMRIPDALSGTVELFGLSYPSYRFVDHRASASRVGIGLYLLIHSTRIGMLIRAGASKAGHRGRARRQHPPAQHAGIRPGRGARRARRTDGRPDRFGRSPGMGERVLILTLVVIVTGGIGSIRGAFYGALIVGVVDTIGRVFLPTLLREVASNTVAEAAGPAIASMLIYLLMALVLAIQPQGLFPVRHG